MPNRLTHKEVMCHCLQRIRGRQYTAASTLTEIDWLSFVSAFDDCWMKKDEIEQALKHLQELGEITLGYPRPYSDPDCFTITYRSPEVEEASR
jgi:hypothetical protein